MHLRLKTYPINDSTLLRAWTNFSYPQMSPFLNYDYLKNVYKFVKFYTPGQKPVIITIVDNENQILLIAPLKIDRFGHKVRMLGDLQGCGKTGFLYNPILSLTEKKECLECLFLNIFPQKDLKLQRLDVNSIEHQFLVQLYPKINFSNIPCVKIAIPLGGQDALRRTLSKSIRQNLRTAYNRANRDNII